METKQIDEIDRKLDGFFKRVVAENNPLSYFSKFICPEIAGAIDVKKAVLLMLVSRDFLPKVRHRIHIGLVGKPGTGKTVFMEYLEREHGAFYLTQDTSVASLKGDARKHDYGVQVFKRADEGIVCFDEIELMKDRETLRDAMEKGEVVYTKGGGVERYDARVRVVVGSNSFKKLSSALVDRLDFVFEFDVPSRDEAKEIARKVVGIYAGREYERERKMLLEYLSWVRGFNPVIESESEEKIGVLFDQYFDWFGEGRSGRWIAKVLRIATAYAKLFKRNVGVDDVKVALKLANNSSTTPP